MKSPGSGQIAFYSLIKRFGRHAVNTREIRVENDFLSAYRSDQRTDFIHARRRLLLMFVCVQDLASLAPSPPLSGAGVEADEAGRVVLVVGLVGSASIVAMCGL